MLYIDITRLYNTSDLTQLTGVDKVNIAYIRYLGKQSCAVLRYPNYWLFFPYELSQEVFDALLKGKHRKVAQNVLVKKINAIRFAKPIQGEKNYLLNTAHSGLEKPEFTEFMEKYGLKGIYFLHDLIPIDYPEYCREGEKQKHQIRLQTMSKAELVICNSQYTLSRWERYCKDNGLSLPKSVYAHIAPDDAWQNKTAELSKFFQLFLPKTPYFVVLGTIEGRKNHLLLLNIWRELWREMDENCPKLLIIGKRGWECEQVLDSLDRSEELKHVVTEINNCSDKDLNYFIHHCEALLFPSFEEGYGLPLIEAFKAGIPVIASQIPAFEEINIDDIATLISPIDSMGWKKAILAYSQRSIKEKQYYQQTIVTIQDKLPTWRQHFERITPYFNFLDLIHS